MDSIIEICRVKKEVFIYGAGSVANIVYVILKNQELEKKIAGFIVSNMKDAPYKRHGISVFGIDDVYLGNSNDMAIVVAVNNNMKDEVVEELKTRNVNQYVTLDSEKLIDDFYSSLYFESIKDNKILFVNTHGRGYGCNPKYIASELIKRDKKHEIDIVWAVNNDNYSFPDRIRTVRYESYEYYKEIATSKIWIDNNRKKTDIKKRDGQFYIQSWHGAAPIKRVEMDAENVLPEGYILNAKHDSEMADLMVSGSLFYTNLYKHSFWYNGNVLESGLPRHDVFWHVEDAKRKVYENYNIPMSYFLVLYAPTFRRVFDPVAYDIDLERVKVAFAHRFKREVRMAVSKHALNLENAYPFEVKEDYIDVSLYDDFEEILAAADALITDYSGIMYDFSFKRAPVFLFQNDYDSFLHERDFYVPMNTVPYIVARDNDSLCKEIIEFDEHGFRSRLDAFMEKMGNYDDGHASERVVDWILKKMNLL